MKLFDSHPDYYTVPDDYTDSERQQAQQEAACNETDKPAEGAGPDEPKKEPRHCRRRHVLLWTVVILLAVLAGSFWLRYLNPYVTDGREVGYVVNLERRGYIFKTWEGQLVLQRAVADSQALYSRDFTFSVDDKAVAEQLLKAKEEGQCVRVTYDRYQGTLPWRGSSQFIVVGLEPVDNKPNITLEQL